VLSGVKLQTHSPGLGLVVQARFAQSCVQSHRTLIVIPAPMGTGSFTFRKHASLGATAAEEDEAFLRECFVDNGTLTVLKDCHDHRRILLGRTGAGKTALIRYLAEQNQEVIALNPETLAFNNLTSSVTLQFFLDAGVKLNLFFKLLWRHVLTVELLRHKYKLKSKQDTITLITRFKKLLGKDQSKERALEYLRQWGEEFWEDSEYRIKEITQKFESDLTSSLEGAIPPAQIKVGAAKRLSEEHKSEVFTRGMNVVNKTQMKVLTDVLKFLAEDVFDDEQCPVYVCIDRLDDNWVDDRFRYLLIRSLIETIRDFLQVKNVKVVACFRTDLLERVFRETRDSGFQEEKYRSLYLNMD
jgi:hypothetical protein